MERLSTSMIENFDFGAAMTAISVVLMAWIAFQFYWKPRREDRWRRELDNHKDRTETIQQLSNDKIWVQYKNDLSTFLDKGDRFFGLSWWRIYDQCLLVAFVYPLVLFLFSWAFGGNGSLGEANLLPDSLSWLGRLGYMIFLSFLFFFIFFWTKNSDKIAHRSIQYLPSPFAAQVRKRRWLIWPSCPATDPRTSRSGRFSSTACEAAVRPPNFEEITRKVTTPKTMKTQVCMALAQAVLRSPPPKT